MSRDESGYSERVGARISPELKEHLRTLVDDGVYDSEADAVREALWQYVEQREIVPLSEPEIAPTSPATTKSGETHWLLSTLLILMAIIGSRVLNILSNEKTTPAALAEEAIQETIYNHHILKKRLKTARHLSHKLSSDD